VLVKAGTKRTEKVPPGGGSLVSRIRSAGWCLGGGGRRGGGLGSGLEQEHPRVSYGRGEWTSQDQRPEEHTKASELAIAGMD
jgi:hypothetical protein